MGIYSGMDDAAPSGSSGRAPGGAVFIIGSPRSGTSALSWALAAHPDFATSAEADFPYYVMKSDAFADAWAKSVAREDGMLAISGMDRQTFLRLLGTGIDAVFRAVHGDEVRWVDSSPANTIVADRLAEAIPDAKFIHIVRDGRAAVASMVKSGFDARVAQDFRFACETWAFYVRKGRAMTAAMPERAMELSQERMGEDPEGAMGEVLAFLGVGAHPGPAAQLRGGRINSSYGNAAAGDVKRPKSAEEMPREPWADWTVEAWRTFCEVAGDVMDEAGYAWTRPELPPVVEEGASGDAPVAEAAATAAQPPGGAGA